MADEQLPSEDVKQSRSRVPNLGLGTALGAGIGVAVWASSANWVWALAAGAISGLVLAFVLPERNRGRGEPAFYEPAQVKPPLTE